MKIEFSRILKMLMIAGLLGSLSACSEDDLTNIDFDFDSAEEAILSLIASSDSLENINGFGDGGAVGLSKASFAGFSKSATDTLDLIKFGRRIDSVSFERSVEITGDSIAIVTSIGTISGDLLIIVLIPDSTNSDTIVKPFSMEMTRKIKLRRIGEGAIRKLNWRIVGVTPVVGGSVPTSLDFSNLSLISSGGDSLIITDPLTTFYSWQDLPAFAPDVTVDVFLTLSNESEFDSELVFLHHGARSRTDKRRKLLRDDGDGVDESADDNTYSGSFLMARGRMRHGFVDAIDWGTIFNIDGEINTKVWGLPYRSRR